MAMEWQICDVIALDCVTTHGTIYIRGSEKKILNWEDSS